MMTDDILDQAELAIDNGTANDLIQEQQQHDQFSNEAALRVIAEDAYFWAVEQGFNNTEACACADAAVIDYEASLKTI